MVAAQPVPGTGMAGRLPALGPMIGRLTKGLITMITSKKTRICAAIAAAAAAAIVTLAGCGSPAASHHAARTAPPASTRPAATAPASAPPASQAPAPATTPAVPVGLAPGTRVSMPGGGTLTVDSVRVTAGPVDGQKPSVPPYPRFVIAHFTSATTAGNAAIPEDFTFRDYGAVAGVGVAYEPDRNAGTNSATTPEDSNGVIRSSGWLVFDVPATSQGVIAYVPGIGASAPVVAAWAAN